MIGQKFFKRRSGLFVPVKLHPSKRAYIVFGVLFGLVGVYVLVRVLAATDGGPAPMEVISHSAKAYASSGTASAANDVNYDTTWSSGGAGWLAYDMASVSAAKRGNVVVAWYNNQEGYAISDNLKGACPGSGGQAPTSYSIEANPAAGGGSVPTSGWVTLVNKTTNTYQSRQNVVNMTGYNWIRLSVGSSASINVDVADASAGVTDDWLFLGDSITARYATHATSNGVRSIPDLISTSTSNTRYPIQENAGLPCVHASDVTGYIDSLLAMFPGKYVTLNLGTNDLWNGAGDVNAYYNDMQTLANKVIAAGKIPVIPHIPWPNNGGSWDTIVQAGNAKIDQLIASNSKIVRGPDLYAAYKGHSEYFVSSGDVHPNAVGVAIARQQWASAMMTNVYANYKPGGSSSSSAISAEAENGVVSGNGPVTVGNDASASGGKYIQFSPAPTQ